MVDPSLIQLKQSEITNRINPQKTRNYNILKLRKRGDTNSNKAGEKLASVSGAQRRRRH